MSKTMFTRDGMGRISRRSLLMTVPTLLAAPRLMAQGASAPLKMRAFNHMTLSVSDPKRSLDFYQGLFGMPIQARQGATTVLRIGSGPQFVAIGAAGSNPPSINHYCVTVEDFNVDRVLKVLADHGVTKAEPPAAAERRADEGPRPDARPRSRRRQRRDAGNLLRRP